jgi:hypothetical protein
MNFIPLHLMDVPDKTTPEYTESLSEHAIGIVLKYCSEQVPKTEDGKQFMASRTIRQVRNHFNTTKWWEAAAQLKVSWSALIDQLLKDRQIMVTNGFVWVRNVERETNGS